jgi:XTP/dITP diphosphohydrolase
MKKIVLASNNQGKLAELKAMFAPLGLELVSQAELGLPEAEEPFRTFVENALAKARQASRLSGLPALADDAGLCVDAFGGLPGVDTAFYATRYGYTKGDDNNVKALLEQMAHLPRSRPAPRRAGQHAGGRTLRQRPRAADRLRPRRRANRAQPLGDNGFGFDPVMFIPEFGKTFAQLPVEIKNANSHRGKAARQMIELMRERWL